MQDLVDKIVFISGGSRGIGAALVEAFSSVGSKVIFSYKSSEGEAIEIAKQFDAHAVQMNVCDVGKIRETEKVIREKYGRLDVLVNNAGINNPTDFDLIEEDEWDEILDTNLKGPFLVSQVFFKLLSVRGGSIVNISSVSGQYGGPRTAHYAASKAGLISLSQVMARFGADKNIRSNALGVGLIESPMAQSATSDPAVKKAVEGILLKRFGTYDEVARAALFLSSNMSSYVTGQTLNVNGGLYF